MGRILDLTIQCRDGRLAGFGSDDDGLIISADTVSVEKIKENQDL
jgi:hypothetical protein